MLDPVTKGYLTLLPQAAANTLLRLEERDLRDIFEAMPRAVAATVLEQMASAAAGRCLAQLPNKTVGEILAMMPLPAAVAVLRHFQRDQVMELLQHMPRMLAVRVRIGLRYAEALVGAFVDINAITFTPELRVGDALRQYRREGRHTGQTIYVLEQQRHLSGSVQLEDLLRATDRSIIRRVMQPAQTVLSARATLQSVAHHPAWLTNDSLPVVNRNDVYQGVLRRSRIISKHEELIDTVTEQNEMASTRSALADILWMAAGALFIGGTKTQTQIKED